MKSSSTMKLAPAIVDDSQFDGILVPLYDSPERQSTQTVATFNLVATIVGGGVLSLPLAFAKCGVAAATLLMILAAVVTDFSLHLLCRSARQTGASSYGEVGRVAFGAWMERFISLLLAVFLMFVLVAYMVLSRDIWTPLVGLVLGGGSAGSDEDPPRGDLVLLGILVFLAPFLVQRTLHSLRFNCYIGFCSVAVLCLALCRQGFLQPETSNTSIRYTTHTSAGDILFSLPIILLSFLSHFNVLPIQGALLKPSRQRMGSVVNAAIAACFILMYLFGLGGYLMCGTDTEGNILINVSKNTNFLFLMGRVGCGVTILLATPMMLLPCRDAILEIIDVTCVGRQEEIDHHVVEESIVGEHTALLRHEPIQQDLVFQNPYLFYGSTLIMVTVCYLGAVAAPGVAIVWSLCGSSMAFLIAFILPAACYIEIERQEATSDGRPWVVASWLLLVASVLIAIACTIQTMSKFH